MFTILGADGHEYGPADSEQVKTWISDGRANLDTKAKRVGEDQWRRLGDYPEFGGVAGAPPPLGQVAPATSPVVAFDPKAYSDDLIARARPLDIGSCLERGWNLVKTDFWAVVGGCAIILMIFALTGGFHVGNILSFFFGGVLMGGLYYYLLKKIRNQSSDIVDVFAGFTIAFLPLFLAGIVTSLLTALGFVLLVIPGIYLAVGYAFTYMLAIDKKLDFWSAMEVSRRIVTAQWWRVFLLAILGGIIAVLGLIGLIVGVFITSAISITAMVYAYEDLCNPPPRA